jgi:CheY-like chemotaxis protein
MDLAMPGIDGWETIRRIRQQQLSQAKVAIVSANAFNKGLENDVGIAPEDFILKPIEVEEFLDWIGQSLAIKWLDHEPPPPLLVPSQQECAGLEYPSTEVLRKLDEMVSLGYIRGILKKIDEIEAQGQHHAEFTQVVRRFVGLFQLEALSHLIKKGLAGAENQV